MPRKHEIPGDVTINGSISATSYVGVQGLPYKLFVGRMTFTGFAPNITPTLEIIYMDDFFGNLVATSITDNGYYSNVKIQFINNPSLTFTNNFSYTTTELTYGFDSTFVGGNIIKPNTGDSKILDLLLNGLGSLAYPDGSGLNPLYIEIKVFPA